MNYEQFEIVDAFLALKDVDDDVVDGMLREGKSFTVNRGSKDLEAAKEFLSEHADEENVAIEVIDVNADSVDHIKNNQDYIGQAILSCNKCRSNKFIDMDLLKVSDGDDDVYNRDDECPHCHDAGAGYELIGQVGKMSTDTEDEEIDDTEATIDNDDKEADVTTFDNDIEELDEVEEEEPADEDIDAESDESVDEVDFLSDEDEESDDMETDTSEDELDDLDLPSLGDEIDPDDTEEDEDNDVKESLTESVELTGNAADAWMMNQVISHMNNEDAYYGSWLYIWPDGETKEMCYYDFSEQDDFDELEETYLRTYRRYHSDGLYNAPADVYNYARATDRKLGLAPIENLAEVKPFVRESLETDLVSDVVKSIINPEHIDTVVVTDGDRVIYEGSFEDLPRNIYGAECKHFDVADGYLSCNIDLEETVTNSPLGRFLDKFGDNETEKITLWDQATNDEVFTGTRDEAIKRYGNFEFSSVEAPSVLRLTIIGPEFVAQSELEDEEISDLEKLANKVLTENNMSVYRSKNTKSDDFWVKHSIQHLEDIELIYERYVKPTGNKALIKEFKSLTGYSNPVEEAFEAGFNAANEANSRVNARRDESRRAASANREMINEAGPSRDLMIDAMQKVGKRYNFKKYTDAQIFRMYQKYVLDKPKRIDIEAEVHGQDKVEFPRCEACGIRLNDGGTCPVCDHGEPDMYEDLNQANIELPEFYDWIRNYKGGKLFDAYADEFSDEDELIEINGVLEWLKGFDNNAYHDFLNRAHIEEDLDGDRDRDPASDVETVEAVRSFKNRKDLAHAIQECKNNNRPYSVRRSTIEGYRYDLITEDNAEIISDDNVSIVPSRSQNDDLAQYSPQQLSFMNELQRIGKDTANAIHQYYGIDADPAIIIADIIRDLKLISGDVSIEELTDSVADQATLAMFNSYNDFYNVVDAMISSVTGQEFHTTPDRKLRQAIRMLHGPNFTTDAINNAIGSTAFLRAAQNGNIPFIQQSDIPLLTEALSRCCEKCGKLTCECSEDYDEVEDDVLDLDLLLDDESSEELEIDTDLFDADLNQYFNEAYEDTVIYTTTSGHINENGVIVLEGLIQLDETINDISFKLDPGKAICESLTNKTKDISSILDATFNVTNNLSDETFEFRFKQ